MSVSADAAVREGGRPQAGGSPRLLVVVSHPIQYHAPLYRRLAESASLDLTVAFLTDFGTRPSRDPGFGRDIAYDVPLVEGYRHVFVSTGTSRYPRRTHVPSASLLQQIRRRYYDVVLVHGYATAASWIAAGAARLASVPYLMRGETQLDTEVTRPLPLRIGKRLALTPLLRGAGACLAIGIRNRAFYRRYGVPDDRIIHAPYSVDNTLFARQGDQGRSERASRLRSVGLDPDCPTAVFAAKLQAHKRPMDVVEAVRKMRLAVNLVMIGDGPLGDEVSRQAARLPRVALLGFVNQSEIGKWFGAADIMVLPSEREPWGLVVNEAMAAGCVPVVSAAVGCAPDLVEPSDGAVVAPADTDALASVLDRLAGDRDALAGARSRSRRLADTHSIERTAIGYETAVALACR